MILYPVIVILIATRNRLSVGLGRHGDLSYGVYLFHFPTIQLLQHQGVYDLNQYLAFLISIILTLSLAAISWHFVEKRFLLRSSHYVTIEESR